MTFFKSFDASGQEPQYFESSSRKPRLTFRWDALARYDAILNLPARPDIERGRFEVRPELALEFSERFKIGVRAVGNLGTDENTENARNFDNYRSRGAAIERYYVEARPGRWTIRAGSFGMPLVASELLWDQDIQTPGLAVAWEVPAGSSRFTFAAGGFFSPQREGDRTRIGAAQIVWRTGDPSRFAAEAALSYWHFEPEDLKDHYTRQNHFALREGKRFYLSDFRILDGSLRFRFPVGGLPVSLSLNAPTNYGTKGPASHDRSAFEGALAVGRLGTPGDWRAFYIYQYVERDAVLGAYNSDDWWFHTRYRGHRTGVAFTVLPQVFVQGALMFQKRLDLKRTLNRMTVDLVKMF